MAGLFFCLAFDTVQGFCFARRRMSRIQAFAAPFVPSMQLYCLHYKTARKALQWHFQLFAVFCCCCVAGASGYSVQPAQRWRAYQRTKHLYRYQIPPPRRTPCRSAQPPYYNKVYKGAAVRPCYRSMPESAAHRRPCQPGGVSSYRLQIAGKCCTRRAF